jgi:hypothetical protein
MSSRELSAKQLLWIGTGLSLFGALALLFGSRESLREIVHTRGADLPAGVLAVLSLVSGIALVGMGGISAWRARRENAPPAPTVDVPPVDLPRAKVVRRDSDT